MCVHVLDHMRNFKNWVLNQYVLLAVPKDWLRQSARKPLHAMHTSSVMPRRPMEARIYAPYEEREEREVERGEERKAPTRRETTRELEVE